MRQGGEGSTRWTRCGCQPLASDQALGLPVLDYPGTVGWKTGFRFIKDKVFSVTPNGTPANPLDAAGQLL